MGPWLPGFENTMPSSLVPFKYLKRCLAATKCCAMAQWRNKSRKFRNSKRDIRSWPAGLVEQTAYNSAVELMVCSLQNLTCVDASQTSNHWCWHRRAVLHTKALQQFTHKLCLIQNHILPILINCNPVSQVHGHWPSLDLKTLMESEVTITNDFDKSVHYISTNGW